MNHSWKTIAEIFDTASGLCAADRSRYLLMRCGRDDELRREVESLLEQDARVGGYLIPPYTRKLGSSENDELKRDDSFD